MKQNDCHMQDCKNCPHDDECRHGDEVEAVKMVDLSLQLGLIVRSITDCVAKIQRYIIEYERGKK